MLGLGHAQASINVRATARGLLKKTSATTKSLALFVEEVDAWAVVPANDGKVGGDFVRTNIEKRRT